ncbi:hypothetical protein LJC58_07555 [Lachnospiraceae bacterium OttesenSCG-928-D06]|nr:hypothetical protein [Lachnospiraceae bacterium OttesenSCG-928-D06]
MKKRIITVLLMAAIAMGITACGNSKGETENKDTKESVETEVASGTEYIFEAEYTVLTGLEGLGVSGSPTGIGLAKENAKTSNGFYVGELGTKSPITFVITSDVDTSATLKAVLGSNTLGNCTWNPTSLVVTVNGEAISYAEFTTDNGTDASEQENFKTKNLGEIQLKAGENEIVFVAGDNTYRSNMPSAPSIDCLKITADAVLSMEEMVENIE